MLTPTAKNVRDRLAEVSLHLPQAPAPLAIYVPATVTGDLVFTAGQLPLVDGQLAARGIVGSASGPSIEEAAELAGRCALNALAAVEGVLGDLDRVTKVVKMVVFVASGPDFEGHSVVANGASRVNELAFGDAGQHARSAVGVASLPLGAPVEVELVVQFE